MPARRKLIVAAALTFVVGVVLMFPARVAISWFAPPDVVISGIEGTVWRGSARQALVNGLYLRDLQWRFKPLQLFAVRLGYAVEARPASGFVDANVAAGLGGRVTFSDLTAAVPLELVAQAIRVPGLSGSASLQFDRLSIADGMPVKADGTLTVEDLVAPQVSRSSIGGYRGEFFTQDGGITASVEDTDGVIDLAGSLQLNSDRTYQFIAQVAPKPNTPESIRRQFRILGSPNERGQHELRLEGTL